MLTDDRACQILMSLTPLQRIILWKLMSGLTTNLEIGKEIFLPEQVIKNQFSTIYRKVGVENRVQITMLMMKTPFFEELLSKVVVGDMALRAERRKARREKNVVPFVKREAV